ncbi:MAG: HAD family hydrolase [Clostridia bacterium]|nr:HAD family hydrolase [Clostridia bacterium]
MIKLCIFDLDGTLLDTITTIAYYANYALEKHGVAPISVDRYKYLVGTGAKNLIHGALRERGCDGEALFERVFADYNAAYNANVTYLTAPYDGIVSMLEGLRKHGIKTAIVSNKPDFATKSVVREIFGDGYFDFVTGQVDGVPIKPDPTAVLNLIERLGIQKDECVYVGDTSTDMKTGKNAGLYTIGVLWGFRDRAELEENGADVIVAHPDELLEIISAK